MAAAHRTEQDCDAVLEGVARFLGVEVEKMFLSLLVRTRKCVGSRSLEDMLWSENYELTVYVDFTKHGKREAFNMHLHSFASGSHVQCINRYVNIYRKLRRLPNFVEQSFHAISGF